MNKITKRSNYVRGFTVLELLVIPLIVAVVAFKLWILYLVVNAAFTGLGCIDDSRGFGQCFQQDF